MIYYIGLNVLVFFLSLLSALYRSKLFLVILFFVIFIFSAFRYDAGNDFFSYLDLAAGEKWISDLEPFPILLIKISQWVGDPVVFFILSSVVYLAGIYFGLKRFRELTAISACFAVFYVMSYLTSFGYVRQYMGIGMAFLSISYFYAGVKKWAAFFFVLALMSHYSAIIVAPIFLSRYFLCRSYQLSFYVISLFIALFFFDILIFKFTSWVGIYEQYAEFSGPAYGMKIFLIYVLSFFYLLVFYKFFRIKNDRLFRFSLNCSFFGLVIYAALLSYGEYLVRVAYYFVPFVYIAFSRLYITGRFKIFQLLVIISLLSLTFYSTLYVASQNPNRNFLTNIEFYPY